MARVLVCDDESSLREMLGVLLRRSGYEVDLAADVRHALEALGSAPAPYDAVITDLALPDGTGMDVLGAARQRDDSTQVVVITAFGSTENAVQAMRLGAYDFITKPFRNHEILALLEKALEKHGLVDENRKLRARVAAQQKDAAGIIGRSPAITRVLELARRVAPARTSVLITGESGTGKEMIARAIHQLSDRADRPFVTVNCGAIPEALIESELFGHEKGAFTGAHARTEGLFRAAEGGTLFLDEIGDLPPAMQVKLLRALQERKVRPVGGPREIETDVRVVAATNRDLERDVADGRFRSDLFYRLNVIRIHLPPLRERPEDVPALADHFLQKHADLQGKRLRFSAAALRSVASHEYPGNVRELENVIERAVTLAVGSEITLDDLPGEGRVSSTGPSPMPTELGPGFEVDRWLADLEKGVLLRALEQTKGNQTAAARLLGTSFRSFRYRLRKYGLADPDAADASTEAEREDDT